MSFAFVLCLLWHARAEVREKIRCCSGVKTLFARSSDKNHLSAAHSRWRMAHFGLDRTVLKRKEAAVFLMGPPPEFILLCCSRAREREKQLSLQLCWEFGWCYGAVLAGRVISKLLLLALLTLMEYYSLMYSPARPQGQEYIIRRSRARRLR